MGITIEYPMKFIRELKEHHLFVLKVNDVPVRVYVEKKTGRRKHNAKDLAKALGFKDEFEMMGNDKILDMLNKEKKRTGRFPYSETPKESDL